MTTLEEVADFAKKMIEDCKKEDWFASNRDEQDGYIHAMLEILTFIGAKL